MNPADIVINYWAVLACGALSMILGSLWYGPVLGKQWMALSGHEPKEGNKDNVGLLYFWMFVGSLITVYVLGHIIALAGAETAMEGASTGFWVWLGFLAAGSAGQYLFPPKPLALFALDKGYQLVFIVLSGIILAIW